ncbi:MAG: UvrB/UvrC motif-containing protein [Alicyclobacillus herbarius]|uniref:UvrB/UvrC motif-containing protein n=1 Tax=Alicyclobacillus herbarius TaxID=122960 RepID=UPI002355E152|nr:UvrB/UvrC motif-containing protein [Alicyclobacillus herbarius]MCL6633831.1 UvrB/UvrC motif-containing protein [Alicyclobacillus herbarius]
MLCQRCQQRPASVQFTKIVNGQKSVQHLCEQCAREQGNFFAAPMQALDFNHLLSGLLNMESSPGYAPAQVQARCSNCGMTYQQFTKVGRLGCPTCYESFAARLEPLLKRIQNGTEHIGKIPIHAGKQVQLRKNLERLRQQLKQAVAFEHFEEAARLRDEIRSLEQQLESNRG